MITLETLKAVCQETVLKFEQRANESVILRWWDVEGMHQLIADHIGRLPIENFVMWDEWWHLRCSPS